MSVLTAEPPAQVSRDQSEPERRLESQDATPPLLVLQTCVPDYRVAVFQLMAATRPGTLVAAGQEHFTAEIKTQASGKKWYVPIANRFFLRRRLLWQEGALKATWRADVVIAEWNPRVISTWLVLLHRRLRHRPTLVWGHVQSRYRGLFGRLAQWLRSRMADFADGVVTYTAAEARVCRAHIPGVPVWVAPNSDVLAAEIRAAMDDAIAVTERNDAVFIGRLTPKKKPMLLLEAWLQAGDTLPPGARLVFVGAGPERAKLEQRVAEAKPARPVVFLGHVNDPHLLRGIYQRALVAVSPGYVGLSAIQAMAHAVPMLVARDEPHSPEIVVCRDGLTAQFVASNSPSDMAAHLASFYRESPVWQARRMEIARYIEENYTIERMVAGFGRAVRGLADRAGEPQRAVIVWEQYGPYHFARLRAAQQQSPAWDFVGLELSTRSSHYQWERSLTDPDVHCLETGQQSEEIGLLTVYTRARHFFSRVNARVVFVPSYWPPWVLAILLAARERGLPTVMMNESHADTSRASGLALAFKRRLIRSFNAGLVGGSPQLDYFATQGLSRSQMFDGYDVVDNAYFIAAAEKTRAQAAELRSALALPRRFFLSVGRMELKKDLFTLVDAYVSARRRHPAAPRLVFLGSGRLEARLRGYCLEKGLIVARHEAVSNAGLQNPDDIDVHFFGFRQVGELPAFYALALAFVLPSRREEWGLVVNEAMACGTPVIVSNAAGCARDLVVEGVNGFTFAPGNAEALADHLMFLAANDERSRQMGNAARETIRQWGCGRFAANAVAAAELATGPGESEKRARA